MTQYTRSSATQEPGARKRTGATKPAGAPKPTHEPKPSQDEAIASLERENDIDEALIESFPASDPPPWTPGVARGAVIL